jgi:UrcA family protein
VFAVKHLSLNIAVLAGAAGLALAASPASAQEYGSYGPAGYQTSSQEQIQVLAPQFRTEHTPLNAPFEKVSLSTEVPYGDLDLRTGYGARQLHHRIRDAAWQVCTNLRDTYPYERAANTSCFKTAYENGIVSANQAIGNIRVAYRQSY